MVSNVENGQKSLHCVGLSLPKHDASEPIETVSMHMEYMYIELNTQIFLDLKYS